MRVAERCSPIWECDKATCLAGRHAVPEIVCKDGRWIPFDCTDIRNFTSGGYNPTHCKRLGSKIDMRVQVKEY